MTKELQIDIPTQHTELFKTIGKVADGLNQDVFVVGGYVRDVYLDRLDENQITDIDFVTLGSGISLARAVAKEMGAEDVSVFKKFGTAQVKHGGLDLEFVGARKESYRSNSRKPIVEDGTLEDDQLRRDLTINALSWSLNRESFGVLYDPFHGIRDLKKKIIRTPIDPETTFEDDPLRMMRAVRFASQLGFVIEEDTFAAIQKMAHRLSIISMERITDELNKMVLCEKPSYGFELLLKTGLLEQFFPEMVKLLGVDERNGQRHKDNFWHTLKVLDNVAEVSDDLWLRWAAIMHDIAKPPTKRFSRSAGWTFHGHDALGAKWTPKIFRRLGLPLDHRMKYVQKLVRLHLRPIALVSDEVSDSAIRRLIYEAGDDIDDLMTLCRADITSKNEWRVKKYRRNFDRVEEKIKSVEEKDKMRNWTNPVSGEDVMDVFGVKPGPIVGRVKDQIKEAILDGEIQNSREAAFEYLLKLKESYNKNEKK
ncbi:MAG: HD domain-containing protein [Bacteroidetes bacterium]|jgi:tRNA nucleotidyltransferase (CCA-adding enzyme)|nr:HD domain-containing protein [Bacteroidota bacterium]